MQNNLFRYIVVQHTRQLLLTTYYTLYVVCQTVSVFPNKMKAIKSILHQKENGTKKIKYETNIK